MSPPRSSELVPAVLFGVSTGLRSMLPLALLSLRAHGPRRLGPVMVPLAATKLARDKMAHTSSRLAPVPLLVRLVVGGAGAAWLLGRRRRPAGASAVLAGTLAALTGALVGFRVRTGLPAATGTPDTPWAVLEDLTAAGLALTAIHLAHD